MYLFITLSAPGNFQLMCVILFLVCQLSCSYRLAILPAFWILRLGWFYDLESLHPLPRLHFAILTVTFAE